MGSSSDGENTRGTETGAGSDPIGQSSIRSIGEVAEALTGASLGGNKVRVGGREQRTSTSLRLGASAASLFMSIRSHVLDRVQPMAAARRAWVASLGQGGMRTLTGPTSQDVLHVAKQTVRIARSIATAGT